MKKKASNCKKIRRKEYITEKKNQLFYPCQLPICCNVSQVLIYCIYHYALQNPIFKNLNVLKSLVLLCTNAATCYIPAYMEPIMMLYGAISFFFFLLHNGKCKTKIHRMCSIINPQGLLVLSCSHWPVSFFRQPISTFLEFPSSGNQSAVLLSLLQATNQQASWVSFIMQPINSLLESPSSSQSEDFFQRLVVSLIVQVANQ